MFPTGHQEALIVLELNKTPSHRPEDVFGSWASGEAHSDDIFWCHLFEHLREKKNKEGWLQKENQRGSQPFKRSPNCFGSENAHREAKAASNCLQVGNGWGSLHAQFKHRPTRKQTCSLA